MRVLITGAAGRIGSAAVEHFLDGGHEVVATDAVFRAGGPAPLRVVDLLDEPAVYGLLEGVDSLVHLGNHPDARPRIPRQRLLRENVAMTANTLIAAVETGVRRIVYASSIQATMNLAAWAQWGQKPEPCPFAYLPADGRMPHRTGLNPYALSKAHGEHLLRELSAAHPELAAVALRLPGVVPVGGWPWQRHNAFRPGGHELSEAMSSLSVLDACRLFEAALRRSPAGYRCHFPASCRAVAGIGPAELARDHLGHVPVTGDLHARGGLADLGPLQDELGWCPQEPTPLLWPEAS